MDHENPYEKLIGWFRQHGAYVPESEELAPLIEACYTPDEAEFLTGMPLALTDLQDIADLKDVDEGQLVERLDELANRGLVFRSRHEGRLRYRLNPPRFVFLRSFFWPGRLISI